MAKFLKCTSVDINNTEIPLLVNIENISYISCSSKDIEKGMATVHLNNAKDVGHHLSALYKDVINTLSQDIITVQPAPNLNSAKINNIDFDATAYIIKNHPDGFVSLKELADKYKDAITPGVMQQYSYIDWTDGAKGFVAYCILNNINWQEHVSLPKNIIS